MTAIVIGNWTRTVPVGLTFLGTDRRVVGRDTVVVPVDRWTAIPVAPSVRTVKATVLTPD